MMLAVEEALERICAVFDPLPLEYVALSEARGRVLAQDLTAHRNQPVQAISAMDGYAVRSADMINDETTLTVVGTSAAGGRFEGKIKPGQAIRIFTGGPIPDGADAVMLQENAKPNGDQVRLKGKVESGRFIRPAGLDIRAGDIALQAGTELGARDLGLAAILNQVWMPVKRRPRIAILATGDELVRPGEPLGPDQIVTSNSITLAAMISSWGGITHDLGIVPDRADAFAGIMSALSKVDLVITLGGASVGDRDLVRQTLGDQGLTLDFWKIAMRPGKPLMFGEINGIPMLGLPGNPVSSAVCAILFVRAIIKKLQGLDPKPPECPAVLGIDLDANDERQEYLRATSHWRADGTLEATPSKRQDSAMFAILARSDCLIKRPPFAKKMMKGSAVTIIPMSQQSAGV